MPPVFFNNPALQKREIQIAISPDDAREFAVDIVAHRIGWTLSLRQGPTSFYKDAATAGKIKAEHVLYALATFLARQVETAGAPFDIVSCLEEQVELDALRAAEESEKRELAAKEVEETDVPVPAGETGPEPDPNAVQPGTVSDQD